MIYITFTYKKKTLVIWQDETTLDQSAGALDFIHFKVPAMFKCKAGDAAVERACSQVVTVGGVLPCWISRPYVSCVSSSEFITEHQNTITYVVY